MADYDNTDKGAAFMPFETQQLILQGKINDNQSDRKIVLIKDKTKSGKTLIEVFEKVGTLFPNEKKDNESAPDYTGPISGPYGERRIAAWKRMKESKPYMTFSISDNKAKGPSPTSIDLDDNLPPF